MNHFLFSLISLWPMGDSRPAKLARGAIIAVVAAVLTHLSSWMLGTDFGTATPVVVAGWAVAANAIRHFFSWMNEGDPDDQSLGLN